MSRKKGALNVFILFGKVIMFSALLLITAAMCIWWLGGVSFIGFERQFALFILAFFLSILGALTAMYTSVKVDL